METHGIQRRRAPSAGLIPSCRSARHALAGEPRHGDQDTRRDNGPRSRCRRVRGGCPALRPLSPSRGLVVLFIGQSGTGKTLAAETVAGVLLDVHKIELSSVVSKYIGETEKNPRRIVGAPQPATWCSYSRGLARCSASGPRWPTPMAATPTSRSVTCSSGSRAREAS